jgi:hypothetical protein
VKEFLTKIFQPDDYVGLYLVLIIGLLYLWQWAGRPPRESNLTKVTGDYPQESDVI